MKYKLLFGTIGLLIGIVVMQWTMPKSDASVVMPPVGGVLANETGSVLMTDGSMWQLEQLPGGTGHWLRMNESPIPVGQIQFFSGPGRFVDKNGDMWAIGDTDEWVNYGRPAIGPVAAEQSTLGKVKAKFSGKDGKP